ncbi:MAG: hypothetical protein QXR62_04750 [Candidatus Bathyarchaeia archaeon]
MPDDRYFLIGFFLGMLVGIPTAILILNFFKPQSSSIVFDRDAEGRVSAIHYVRGS